MRKELIAGAIGGIIGAAATAAVMSGSIDRLVRDAYRAETRSLHATVDVPPSPHRYSREESFTPHYSMLDALPLDAKRGFRYTHSDLRTDASWESPILEVYTGMRSVFAIEDMPLGHAVAQLTLDTYDAEWEPRTVVTLQDHDDDGLLDSIRLDDHRNGTFALIDRGPDGTLSYQHLDAPGAQELYDRFTDEYRTFLRTHDIAQQLRDYQPRLEIVRIDGAQATE